MMRRRSFLQSIGAGIAALFVPAVAAKTRANPSGFTPYRGNGVGVVRTGAARGAIFSGDICVWDGAAYRKAVIGDVRDTDLSNPRLRTAIAVPNGSGGFNFMQYPECMDVVMDVEIRG